jgi:flagella basal body P-ring formation protein FlgA
LHDAGVNLATINFVGTTSCTIARGDVQYDERTALQQWIDARQGKVATTQPTQASQTMVVVAQAPKAQPSAAVIPVSTAPQAPAHLDPLPTPEPATQKSLRTLREALVADASSRLSIPAETLQVDFQAQDEKALNLTEPTFKFQIDAVRVRDLGDVQWKVTLLNGASSSKPMFVRAFARAWQNQIVIGKPLAYKAIIQESDVIERRTLADHLSDDPLVTKAQTVGQQAARDLKPGMIMTARMVDPVPLVKSGQYVTVTLNQGAVQIKTVAKAMEGGSFGQSIRVKNESTKDVFEVTLTGPQTATMNTPSTASEKEPAAKVATVAGE